MANDWHEPRPGAPPPDTTAPAIPPAPTGNYRRAALWAFGVLAFISALAISGREATRDIPTVHLMLWRSVLACLVLAILISVHRVPLVEVRPRRWGPHVWRASSHFFGQFCWFYAITKIHLAEVFALEFTYPLLMALLAPLVLGERLTGTRLLAAALGFAGILVVLRPSGIGIGIGTLSALCCALGYAFSSMAIKDLTRTETALSILVSMAVIQALIALGPTLATFVWPRPVTWGWILVATFAGLLAQYCMARAYALADSITVAPLDFFRLPLIAAIGLVAYGETLDAWVLTGGLIIVAANLINFFGERRR